MNKECFFFLKYKFPKSFIYIIFQRFASFLSLSIYGGGTITTSLTYLLKVIDIDHSVSFDDQLIFFYRVI